MHGNILAAVLKWAPEFVVWCSFFYPRPTDLMNELKDLRHIWSRFIINIYRCVILIEMNTLFFAFYFLIITPYQGYTGSVLQYNTIYWLINIQSIHIQHNWVVWPKRKMNCPPHTCGIENGDPLASWGHVSRAALQCPIFFFFFFFHRGM